ncbi:MAG: TIGR03013 family PEP-CTERM/XrtA system glycosyltransferase [Acidobacteriales bacterium]|nr:TIGR03013 family PEP-CTERM/XrtA system glycosyltransferase [Terriglobales bacterium]
MIRLFKVYYPVRTLILLGGEALIVVASIFLGIAILHREDLFIALNYDGGYSKIVTVTLLVLLLSHWFDLYDPAYFDAKGELYFRLLLVPGLLALGLAALQFAFPSLNRDYSALTGLIILTMALFSWRLLYSWLAQQSFLQERVYVLGTGERAQRLVNGLRSRTELGITVVGRSADMEGAVTREAVGSHLLQVVREQSVHRVIVAIQDRRETMPMQELLDLRLQGVHIEEATSWLEKISGRIEVEQLYPSWIIFATGFRFSGIFRLLRRFLNFTVSLIGVLVTLPIIPFVALAIKLDSSGPVLYRQRRVGKQGRIFYCYKFRTMRQDAEADTGATWAADDDPRITRTGKFLRLSRLDEIPQLWCVLKGDMAFVGPRPERPEFVEWLTKELPYYGVRHVVRPGITGWAQIRYKYGNTIEDAKEKLQYDLFYIKNASLGLDILIMFQTIKIVLLGRGAQ